MIDLIENETRNFNSFKTFKEFIKEQDSRKRERTVQFSNWEIGENGLRIKTKTKTRTFPLRDSGMKTLLRTFGMPINFYYRKSPTDMLIRDINRMKDEYSDDSEFLVFLQKPENGGRSEVRAISKPNVRHVKDHVTLLSHTDLTRELFEKASWSDLGIRITSSDEAKAIKVAKGDIINMGMELMYSDVGFFSTTGNPYINRLICTNGAVMKEKNPLLTNFSMSFGSNMTEETFLSTLNHNIGLIEADTKVLKKTFKLMKDNPIKALPLGETQLRKLRSAIGIDKFDNHEKLSVRIMDEDVEKRAINTDLNLYSALDITTRMAKEYDYLNRRRIEGLAGGLILMCAEKLI